MKRAILRRNRLARFGAKWRVPLPIPSFGIKTANMGTAPFAEVERGLCFQRLTDGPLRATATPSEANPMHGCRIALWAFLCLSLILLPSTAKADLNLSFTIPFESATPSGASPWFRASFTQIAANQVQLTIENLLHSPSEFIREMSFNFDGDPVGITASTLPSTGASAFVGLLAGQNAYKSDGDGWYDLKLDFNDSGDRFVGGETLALVLTRAAGLLSPGDFAQLSEPGGGNGTYFGSAHVQAIPPTGGSAWIGAEVAAVPEPTSLLLLGTCLVGIVYRMRRR